MLIVASHQWWAAFDFCGGGMCEKFGAWTQEVYTQVQGKGSGGGNSRGSGGMSVFQWVRNRGGSGHGSSLVQEWRGVEGAGKVLGERRTSHSFQG